MKPVVIQSHSAGFTLLCVSDLHSHDTDLLNSAVRDLRPDIVVFAGDGLHNCAHTAGRNWLSRLADQLSIGVFAVAGNADGPNGVRMYAGTKVYDLGRQPVDVGTVRFIGLPGAPLSDEIDPTGLGSPLYREADAAAWLARCVASHAGPVILVTHAPPRGIVDQSFRWSGSVGSTAVRHFLRKGSVDVRFVICGHVHAQGGRQTFAGSCAIHNVASEQYRDAPIRMSHVRVLPNGVGRAFLSPASSYGEVFNWDGLGELGFLNGMSWPVAVRLIERGISRLSQLAKMTGEEVGECIRWNAESASVWPFRARAFLEGRPLRIKPFGVAEPPRWYIDIETDPWGGGECVWAVAIAEHETGEITQWYLKARSGQRSMLKAVAAALAHIPAGRLLAYSGSRFDERILANHMRRCGVAVPPAIDTAVDLHPAITRAVALPRTSQLKDVLRAFCLHHSDDDLDGMEAASRAMAALARSRPIPERLLRYNREDVRTLRLLTSLIEDLCGTTAPRPRSGRTSGGAARKAADIKKVQVLLSARGMTLEEVAERSSVVRSRLQTGLRVTSRVLSLGFEEIEDGGPSSKAAEVDRDPSLTDDEEIL